MYIQATGEMLGETQAWLRLLTTARIPGGQRGCAAGDAWKLSHANPEGERMKRSMPPIKLSIYRLFLAVGTLLILGGIMFVTYPLIQGGGYPEEDFWLMTIPIGVGILFVLQALLRRRFVGIEEDNAPSWAQLTGTLGLALLAGFGGTQWLDSTLGDLLGMIVFMGLLLLAWSAPKWLKLEKPKDYDAKNG